MAGNKTWLQSWNNSVRGLLVRHVTRRALHVVVPDDVVGRVAAVAMGLCLALLLWRLSFAPSSRRLGHKGQLRVEAGQGAGNGVKAGLFLGPIDLHR